MVSYMCPADVFSLVKGASGAVTWYDLLVFNILLYFHVRLHLQDKVTRLN